MISFFQFSSQTDCKCKLWFLLHTNTLSEENCNKTKCVIHEHRIVYWKVSTGYTRQRVSSRMHSARLETVPVSVATTRCCLGMVG